MTLALALWSAFTAALVAFLDAALPADPSPVHEEVPFTSTLRWSGMTTDEGTWLSLDVSPDGKTIIFDLLGDLYSIPFAGGEAKKITTGMGFNNQPRYSPDGRWLATTSFGVNPGLYKKLPYDPLNDFIPVAPLTSQPYVLVAGTSSGITSVRDLIAAAKAKPGELKFGSAGVGTRRKHW